MNLARAFRDQEQTAGDENEFTAGDVDAKNREQWLGQPHHPGQREQEQNPQQHRKGETSAARAALLRERKLRGHDGDENNVVDAENDLEPDQRKETDPSLRTK